MTKLIKKINRGFFLQAIVIFPLAAIALYFCIELLEREETDEQLIRMKSVAVARLQDSSLFSISPFIDIQKISLPPGMMKDEFSDTSIVFGKSKEEEPFRQLVTHTATGKDTFRISLRTSLIEKEDVLSAVALTLFIIFTALLIALIVLNYRTAQKIFRPFFANLNRVQRFSLREKNELLLEESDVTEFSELNTALMELSRKAQSEYNALQEFTEDVNHELLTPVAVIKSKLELLLQQEGLGSETMALIHIVYQNADRLEKLHRSLVLLSKLDQKESFENQEVNAGSEVRRIVQSYLDFAESKMVGITLDMNEDVALRINESLFSILIGNLISNAIRHNVEKGTVHISLHDFVLRIENTGKDLSMNPEEIFQRFSRDSQAGDSLGLGLAIVKKICDYYHFPVEYTFKEGIHAVTIRFIRI